jgi:hypothetical protein
LEDIEDLDIEYSWYQLTGVTSVSSFFIPGLYYDKRINGYFIANDFGGASYTYYSLHDVEALPLPFYEAEKYYYKNSNDIY